MATPEDWIGQHVRVGAELASGTDAFDATLAEVSEWGLLLTFPEVGGVAQPPIFLPWRVVGYVQQIPSQGQSSQGPPADESGFLFGKA